MRKVIYILGLVLCSLLFWGGECGSDLGEPCKIKGDFEPGEDEIIIQFSVLNPCESQYCIAKGSTDGYCTKECNSKEDCGGGWVCNPVNPFDPELRDKEFCIKKADVE